MQTFHVNTAEDSSIACRPLVGTVEKQWQHITRQLACYGASHHCFFPLNNHKNNFVHKRRAFQQYSLKDCIECKRRDGGEDSQRDTIEEDNIKGHG